jgi:hypothetical protein
MRSWVLININRASHIEGLENLSQGEGHFDSRAAVRAKRWWGEERNHTKIFDEVHYLNDDSEVVPEHTTGIHGET